jgi:predicted O-methyltransferase YrrM
MDFETVLLHPPLLHADRSGNLVSWRAGDRLLRYLAAALREGDATLETGAGITTLVFAMKRCHHTVIVPDQAQVDRILEWCGASNVPTDTLTFKVLPSEVALPKLDPTPLDLVLIDGAHGFPIPLLDWFYAGRRIRDGGLLLVDDIQIWTGHVLYEFLSREPQWRIEHKRAFEFFAARRVSSGSVGEWLDQPYVLHRSFASSSTSMPRKMAGRLVVGSHLARAALSLAQRREWTELQGRLRGFAPSYFGTSRAEQSVSASHPLPPEGESEHG